jgi:hypothetical protein
LNDRSTPPGIAERARLMAAMLAEAERAKAAPPAAEKSEAPPKAEPGQKAKSEDKGKAAAGKKTN